MKIRKILLVEDNEGDILLIREAFEDLNIEVDLNVVTDGEKAIRYIFNEKEYSEAEKPDLILLDINLPKQNGLEVLKKIKQSDDKKRIPVLMLTTSSSQEDIGTAYKNYANCYMVKPDNAVELIEAIQAIEDYWFNLAELSI